MSESGKEVQPAKQEGGKERVTDERIQQIYGKLGAIKKAKWADLCIYKVPSKLRKVKKDAYDPCVVSIGPFHRKHPDVAAMRDRKWHYMLSFVQQTEDPEMSQKFVTEMFNDIKQLDGKVRRHYAEEIDEDKNELAEIMLLDGCFILELFLRYDQNLNYKQSSKEHDPILNCAWKIASLKQDLALLENQIPFFILKKLYKAIPPQWKCKPPSSVASLALNFFHPYLSQKSITDQLAEIGEIDKIKHLLDLLHKFYFFKSLPADPAQTDTVININRGESTDASAVQQTSSPCFFLSRIKIRREKKNSCLSESDPKINTKKWGFNYCASDLREYGVEFKKTVDHHLLNIDFNGRELIIPQLFIHETSSSLFRNLIAYEQCNLGGTAPFVTSYAFLMKSLIHSARDSKFLREKAGIIQHSRLDDEEYLNQFESILDQVVVKDDSYFAEVCDKVNNYCKSCCNFNKVQVFLRARFINDMKQLYGEYFSSTWSFISFLAAAALLILTCFQTYYTVYPRG